MISVKGKIQNGVALPLEAVADLRDGQSVIITFLDDDAIEVSPENASSADAFDKLLVECAVDAGVADFAEQHDHYLYGKPKK